VGAGPAGLCVAEELTKLGHACTVFDAWPQPGGLLIYGIPAFKMDKTIVDQKVDHLRSLGIEFVPETVVGKDITVDELFGRGFQAVFLGHGAAKENVVDVPGIDLNGKYRILGHELGGVYWAMDFLLRGNVAPDRLPARMREPLKVGNKVAVIGGGDTAMDCLRSAIRLGAEQVTCMYRRSEAEMPGAEEERKNAMLEGAEFQYLVAPLGLYGDDDRHVRKIECQRMKLGELDESGRRRFRPIAGSNFTVDVDTVVFAIGFRVARVVVNGCAELETGAWDEIVVDEEAGATSRLGVFAGGDCVHGADLVVTALASAKRAAAGIHRYLSEELS
jgi:glutamate synthase (NADPH/NADH) small chain